MKDIKITLLHITPQSTIFEAISKPYDKSFPAEKASSVVKKACFTDKHESVLEHVVTSWNIEGSSRLELQEHMRHRLASPTVQSTRFTLKKMLKDPLFETDIRGFCKKYFVFPPEEEFEDYPHYSAFEIAYCNNIYQSVRNMKSVQDSYSQNVLKYLICEGLRTKFTWTINLRSLLNFIRLRNSTDAHFEIRYIAREITGILKNTYVGEWL